MSRLPSWLDCFAFCFHFFNELVLSFNSSDSLLRCLVIHVRRFLAPLSKFVRSHTHTWIIIELGMMANLSIKYRQLAATA